MIDMQDIINDIDDTRDSKFEMSSSTDAARCAFTLAVIDQNCTSIYTYYHLVPYTFLPQPQFSFTVQH
jgi:hypothetical protein